MTEGQIQALEEVREIEEAGQGAFSIVNVTEPTGSYKNLCLDISLDTADLARASGGIPLRDRERFLVVITPEFPFKKPSAYTRHTRFAGFPHVQWGRSLCLFQAPDVEWDPSDGMFGFIRRLWNWVEKASLDELDPIGGALHPPVTYVSQGQRYFVVPRVDTPDVMNSPWFGYGHLDPVGDRRVDIRGWSDLASGSPSALSAACILLTQPMPWEFPADVADLLAALNTQGVSQNDLFCLLQAVSLRNAEDSPLYVIIGTPMRGIRGSDDLKQHLTAWRIEPGVALGFRLIVNKYGQGKEIRSIGERCEQIMIEWASKASVTWCDVMEDRPEIVTRRDHSSPMAAFHGKTIAVWGCGALGGQVAIHLARAGVARIILRDNVTVTPGVLVRQPYADADIGKPKSEALSVKLRAIRISTPEFQVDSIVSDVLTSALDSDDWSDGADVVFDCTASRGVRTKLEKAWKDNPRRRATIASMLTSREATHGVTVVATSDHTGGLADVFRKAKIDVCKDRSLRHFADAFYPEPNKDELFQPEPGCSSPTFIGSSADASVIAANLLNVVGGFLAPTESTQANEPTAWAHFFSQPHAVPTHALHGRSFVNFTYMPDIVTKDSRHHYEIRTSARAYKQMELWITRSRDAVGPDVETGGLSFGERNDAVGIIWVTEASGPPADSEARSDRFVCGIAGTHKSNLEFERMSRGSVSYVGMWHTHPYSEPWPSSTDLQGMATMLTSGPGSPRRSLLTIIGTPHKKPKLGTYVFDRKDFRNNQIAESRRGFSPSSSLELNRESTMRRPEIGLSLSGGGSRAIAFHLGCLRALHAHGILDQVGVISAVSGGAVLAAMYAYFDDDFREFDKRVSDLLTRGLHCDIVAALFNPILLARIASTSLLAGSVALGAQLARGVESGWKNLLSSNRTSRTPARISPPWLRWASRTTAFEAALRKSIFGKTLVNDVRRPGLDVILNATELCTGTAFRFGSRGSGTWRYGIVQNDLLVATAVAASAAYPAFLPALHKRYSFQQNDESRKRRVILTDGGVYDNLGASCFDPAQDPNYSTHVYECEHIISCNAGHGQWDGSIVPYWWPFRMKRAIDTMFRKGQDRTIKHLFLQRKSGELKTLVLPYLGMMDDALRQDPNIGPLPDDLVTRNQVIGYPTNFCGMSPLDRKLLAKRGEQLTHLLVEAYW